MLPQKLFFYESLSPELATKNCMKLAISICTVRYCLKVMSQYSLRVTCIAFVLTLGSSFKSYSYVCVAYV